MRILDGVEPPALANVDVHLRDGDMTAVTLTIIDGGVDTVMFVLWLVFSASYL